MKLAFLTAVVIATTAFRANAQDGPSASNEGDEAATPRVPARLPELRESSQPARWYGWQTLLVDAGSVGLVLVPSQATRWIGGTACFAATPLVHVAHGRPAVGLASLAIRAVGFAVAVSGIDAAQGPEGAGGGDASGYLVGAGILVAAPFVDALVFAREPARPAARAASLRWSPTLAVTDRAAIGGVAGTF